MVLLCWLLSCDEEEHGAHREVSELQVYKAFVRGRCVVKWGHITGIALRGTCVHYCAATRSSGMAMQQLCGAHLLGDLPQVGGIIVRLDLVLVVDDDVWAGVDGANMCRVHQGVHGLLGARLAPLHHRVPRSRGRLVEHLVVVGVAHVAACGRHLPGTDKSMGPQAAPAR